MKIRHIRLLVWKEFLQLRRDPLLLRALFAMPIIQLVFFGYVVAADVTNLPTAIVDLDRTPVSRQLSDDFASSGYFSIIARPTTDADLRPAFDSNQIKVAVVIEEGTAARLDRGEVAPLGIVVDGTDSTSASVGAGYASQIVSRFNAARAAASGTMPGVDARVRVQFNPTLATVNTMVPGLIAAILMISIMVIMSQAVVRERESGTLEQMFVTPITRGEYLVGKVLPYVMLASAQAVLVATVGMLWFRVPFNGDLAVVAVGLGLFMLSSVGLGLLVSLVSRTRQQAQQTVMFLMIPSMVLSGFIFPIESMPPEVLPLTRVIPLTYALVVLRGAFVKGAGFEALATPMWALAAFAVVIFGAAVVAVRRRLAE